jgi:hypothetical protein
MGQEVANHGAEHVTDTTNLTDDAISRLSKVLNGVAAIEQRLAAEKRSSDSD